MSVPGQTRKSARLNGMSVLPPTADVVAPPRHVRVVLPKTDMPKSVANGFPTDIAVNGIVDPPNLNIPSNRLE